jgi:hypothetical protein
MQPDEVRNMVQLAYENAKSVDEALLVVLYLVRVWENERTRLWAAFSGVLALSERCVGQVARPGLRGDLRGARRS